MKKMLLFLTFALLAANLYGQKKQVKNFYPKREGYYEIKINKKFSTISALNKYKLHADTTQKNSWIIMGDSLTVFSMDVDFLKVTVDDHDSIKSIMACTKQTTFEDYEEWLLNLKHVLNVVNGDLGKSNSANLSRLSSTELLYTWSFQNTQTSVGLKLPKVQKLATKIKCRYIFTWREEKKYFLDVKY